jgi:RNA-directed DNA polymerase
VCCAGTTCFGLPSNVDRLGPFYKEVCRIWYRALRRRSQRRLTWERYARLLERFALPTPHITQARTVVAY